MKSFGAIAISFRVGQIHWADIASQVGAAEQFGVQLIDAAGDEQEVQLEIAEKWSGGWSHQLRCPRCERPARVMAIANGKAACGRCRPRRTRHHSRKNSRWWRVTGKISDQVVRGLLQTHGLLQEPIARAARRCPVQALAFAKAVADQANSLVEAIDASGLLDQ